MSKPKEMLDAVKTARSIHDGDYSSLHGKSFLVCGNIENKQGRNRRVKKSNKDKMTLSKLTTTVNDLTTIVNDLTMTVSELAKQMNARFDNIEKRLDYNNLKQLPK